MLKANCPACGVGSFYYRRKENQYVCKKCGYAWSAVKPTMDPIKVQKA